MRTTRTTAVLGALLAGLVVTAPAADAVTVKTVSMTASNSFLPATATVTKGTVVRWKNTGFVGHTSTSNTGLWNSGPVGPGKTYSRAFKKAGTFRYHCTIHSSMTGKIVVR